MSYASFTPKRIGTILSSARIANDYKDVGAGVIPAGMYTYEGEKGEHLFKERDVFILWEQLQAAHGVIKAQNEAIAALLQARELLATQTRPGEQNAA